jgi:hypothetical protein
MTSLINVNAKQDIFVHLIKKVPENDEISSVIDIFDQKSS